MQKKRIILVRHAHVEDYHTHGDAQASISDKGWRQTQGLGKALSRYFLRHDIKDWPRVYISSYLRPQQTLSGARLTMDQHFRDTEPKIYEEVRLIEKYFGALRELNQKSQDPAIQKLMDDFQRFSSNLYQKDPMIASALMGDSNIDILLRTKDFIRSLGTDLDEGLDTALIFAHGATIKGFLMNWFHLPMTAWNDADKGLATPHNCDVLVIEGTPKNWQVRTVYDGELEQDCDINPIAHIPHLSVADLPLPPDWLTRQP